MRSLIIICIKGVLQVFTLLSPALAGRFAFHLFCNPARRARLHPREAATMADGRTFTVQVNGHRITVYQWGDGQRPVLLVHGWESRGSRFAMLVEALRARGFSPVTFDAPGHGDSPGRRTTILENVDIIRAAQQRLGPFEAMVAHSFGVLCAFYALKQGIEARRIVAVSGVSEFAYLVEEFCRQLGLRPRVQQWLTAAVERLFKPLDDIWNRFSVTHGVDRLTQPVLVVHDRDDDVVVLNQGEKTARELGARARLHITEGLRHRRILGDPVVVRTIAEFIAAEKGVKKPPDIPVQA